MVRTIVRHSRAYTSTSRVLAHLLAASSWNLKAAFCQSNLLCNSILSILWRFIVKKNIRILFYVLIIFCASWRPQSAMAQDSNKKIEIHAKRFTFEPAEITLKKGETVTLALTSDDVPHSLVVNDLGIKSSIVKGKITEVTVTPTKAGTFQGKCGRFCGSGHGSMKFVVHVTDN